MKKHLTFGAGCLGIILVIWPVRLYRDCRGYWYEIYRGTLFRIRLTLTYFHSHDRIVLT